MKIVKPDNLSLLFRTMPREESVRLVLSAYAAFSLLPGERGLLSEQDMWRRILKCLGEMDVFDTGHPKPRAEFLVHGNCHALNRAPAARVTAQVGGIAKTLNVFGDRLMHGHTVSDPKPFSVMPLTWEHAYGGPAFADNPQGIGHGGGTTRAVPNVMAEGERFDSPASTCIPSSFAALPMDRPQRLKHGGTFDRVWRRTMFPNMPADTAAEIWMTAPEDQRFPRFLTGDEDILAKGMHPEHAELHGRLPGVRARIFVAAKPDPERFIDIETRVDTVWLFPELAFAVVGHRGETFIPDSDRGDLVTLVAGWESLTGERQGVEAFLAPGARGADTHGAVDSEPPPFTASAETMPEVPEPEVEALGSEARNLLNDAEAMVQGLLKQAGLDDKDVEKAMFNASSAEEGEVQDAETLLKELEQSLHRVLADAGMSMEQVERIAEEQRVAQLASASQDDDEAVLRSLDQLIASPHSSPEAREALMESKAAYAGLAASLAALQSAAPAADPATESAVEPAIESAGDSERAPAASTADAEPNPARQQPPDAAQFRPGGDYSGLDLAGIDLSGRDLHGANFSRAILDGANFQGCQLNQADFSQALMREAQLTQADLSHAVLRDAQGDRACFDRAVLVGADLSNAILHKSQFTEATLKGATLEGAVFRGARLNGADCEAVHADKAEFVQASLPAVNFKEARLEKGNFSGADLTRAIFEQAKAAKADFGGAFGEGCRFFAADLTEARADRCTRFPAADLQQANMTRAKWQGAVLTQASLSRARLDGADLSRCDLRGARFDLCIARRAVFDKSNLRAADLCRGDLFRASLRKADLSQAGIRESNLYAANLMGAIIAGADLTGTVLRRTLLDPEFLNAT